MACRHEHWENVIIISFLIKIYTLDYLLIQLIIMKRILLFPILSLFIFSVSYSQQIHYVDYGNDGFIVGINESISMDINSDGTEDFIINSWTDELGFTPISEIGCFSSPSNNAQTAWGSRELQIFYGGEVLSLNFDNIDDYIDDDRGSIYKPGEGFAEGWEDNVPQYIGFAVFDQSTDNVSNGWMKLKVDVEKQQLIILEYAFHDFVEFFFSENYNIVIGDTGMLSAVSNNEFLSNVSISPNPAQNHFVVNYKDPNKDQVVITIHDNLGKTITRSKIIDDTSHTFDTSSWINGLYFVRLNCKQGIHTEKLIITK